jgi:hypothetical protein
MKCLISNALRNDLLQIDLLEIFERFTLFAISTKILTGFLITFSSIKKNRYFTYTSLNSHNNLIIKYL